MTQTNENIWLHYKYKEKLEMMTMFENDKGKNATGLA